MDRENCPHCGARWFIEELNYTLLKNISNYKIDNSIVALETYAKRIESSFTYRCLSCGYHIIREIVH